MNKTLLLVDGSSYLYRAYHAMPDLRNKKGEPTGALYGVINMMRKILQEFQPQYAACVFDMRGKTFREEMYPEYKANRESMPEDLALQIEPIHRAIAAMGWPVIGVEGVEADDVIGTLAVYAQQQGIDTIISTGDKDLAQLVNPHCTLINTMSGQRLDQAGVVEKFGVPPERIVDYLMLVGDTVDNVPGVTKVGPKTAAKWLQAYGSLDALLEHVDEIKGVAGANLKAAIGQFELTRDLITVRTHCDLPDKYMKISNLTPGEPDTDTLIDIYETYGFRTWLRDLTGDDERVPLGDARMVAPVPRRVVGAGAVEHTAGAKGSNGDSAVSVDSPETGAPEYETVTTIEQAQAWLDRIRKADLVAFDTETTSLDAMQARLVGFSLSVEPGVACYVPVAHRGPDQPEQLDKAQVLELFGPWLQDPGAAKLLHHAKYDMHVMANEGIELAGVLHDSMLQAYVLESHRSVALNELAKRWIGRGGIPYEELCGKGAKQIGFDEVELEKASFYACEDADFTLQIHRILYPQVEADDGLKRIYELEIQVSSVLWAIERQGVAIDIEELNRQSHEMGRLLIDLEARAHELAGQPFNLNSPKQLGEILFGKMGLPVVSKTPSGTPSTGEEVLSKLALDYPLPKTLLEYRGLAKLKSTYTDKLPKMINSRTGRVHTHYAQAAVITGRLSSSDPNLQNIPIRTPEGRRVRRAFVASHPDGKIVSADYSQIELRVMAHVSEDEGLRRAFMQGEDIHRATASEVFNVSLEDVTADQRRAAKTINFGLIYGMGAHGLASGLGINRDAAQSYIDRYFARYPGVAEYMASTKAQAHDQGYVQTVFGRRLWLPDINAGGAKRAAAERAAINAPMQGTAADLIKMAMVAVDQWIREASLESRVVMQVHDELVLDVVPRELDQVHEKLPELMCGVATLAVPLLAEVGQGDNWEQAH
ncbi:DNA polymerase I [Orrella marina]|uniref:DNA polymerase I n=1 Tax=Orrella marina TaxID=2163011 RepID=A0A2R4XFK7_9BURK|nr:DNA polymerase I [Orrella marina]AWB32596.1 DNA polymerase I [Orrella marina]